MLFRNIKIYTKFTPSYFDASLLHKYNTINKNIVFSCCVKLTMTLSQIHKDWACADPENSVRWGVGGPDKVRSRQRISQRVVRTSFEGSNCFRRGVVTRISKETYSLQPLMIFHGGGFGAPVPLSKSVIRSKEHGTYHIYKRAMKYSSRVAAVFSGADLGFLERGFICIYKGVGVRFAVFLSFFLNIP